MACNTRIPGPQGTTRRYTHDLPPLPPPPAFTVESVSSGLQRQAEPSHPDKGEWRFRLKAQLRGIVSKEETGDTAGGQQRLVVLQRLLKEAKHAERAEKRQAALQKVCELETKHEKQYHLFLAQDPRAVEDLSMGGVAKYAHGTAKIRMKREREERGSPWENTYLRTLGKLYGRPTMLVESLGAGEGRVEFGKKKGKEREKR